MTNYERRAAVSIMLAAIWVCAATYAILLFLGCGAPPEYLEAAGIGQDEQELIVPNAGIFQVGVRLDGTLQACSGANYEENCLIPHGAPDGYKRIRWVMSGTPGPLREKVRSNFVLWQTSMFNTEGLWTIAGHGHDGWDISEASSVSDPNLTLIIHADSSVSGSCSGSQGNLTRYLCMTGSTTGLTEHGDLVGDNYHRAVGVPVIHIDAGEIETRGLSSGQNANLYHQLTWAAGAIFAGHGLVPTSAPNCTNSTELLTGPCANSPALACLMNNFGDLGNQSDVYELPPDCGF